MGNRNVEIWSTRLQREILALESSSSLSDDPKKVELLPRFIRTAGHTLSIEAGIAKVEFRIDVELAEEAKNDAVASSAEEASMAVKKDDGYADVAKDNQEEGKSSWKQNEDNKEENDNDFESESTDAAKTTTKCTRETREKEDHYVFLVLDASLYWKPDSSKVTQSSNPQCYPFQKPLAIVKSGCNLFSDTSTLVDGDEVDIDLDWTPSIHLTDAVTNVALKIRECVKRGEPLHPSQREERDDDSGLSDALLREAREAKESLLETKKAVGAMFTSGISTLSAKRSSLAAKGQTARSTVSKGFLNLGESLSQLAEVGASAVQGDDAAEGAEGESLKKLARQVVKEVPKIGDEIDLSDEPWSHCVGMYSCKAIQRPEFVNAAIAKISADQKEKENYMASSVFNRFAQSAKSVMEESFLMITEKYLVEFKSNKLTIGSGNVSFAIKIEKLAKLKFRREESLSLFFKQASNDPLVYMCFDSASAVQDIQNVLKRHGVKGKHTNASTQKAIQMALNLVALIQQKEKELIDQPTVNRVNEIMDVYRQAAEKFEGAGDPRHTEVMAHMKRFLNQQFTASILDGTFRKNSASGVKSSDSSNDITSGTPVPQGKILEQPKCFLLNDDEDDDVVPKEEEKDAPTKEHSDEVSDPTIQNMEDILKEAVQDMSDLGMDATDINNILTKNSPKKSSSNVTDDLAHHDDTYAELDAMLNDADEELNELLNS